MFPALGSAAAKDTRPQSPAVSNVATPTKNTTARNRNVTKNASDTAADALTFASAASKVDTHSRHTVASPVIEASLNLPTAQTDKMARDGSTATTSNFPPLPTTSTTLSARNGPKTIRVVPVTKADPKPLTSPVTSRAVSLAQARPDTPASEQASDTASLVSASVSASRAGSPPPPPSRVGSAAIRTTTKSQQRKQRKDQLKQETNQIVEVAKEEPEEHAPVIGRKKKQKKGQPSKTIPTKPSKQATDQSKSLPAVSATVVDGPASSSSNIADGADKTSKSHGSDKAKSKAASNQEARAQPRRPTPPPIVPEDVVQEPIETDDPAEQQIHLGPMSIFADIRKSLWTSAIEKMQLLKPASSTAGRLEAAQSVTALNAPPCSNNTCKCGEIQEDDLAALRAGKAVRKNFHHGGSRMLITPNGDCIRNLTSEEEDAFLELQMAVAATATNPGAFVAPRHQPGSGAFSLIKGRAVPNGRPNIFPVTPLPQSSDPIGKLQREDALSYINQYILPPLNLGTTNSATPKGVSPTRDAAAASLNSLAPYFYGPDAAAGVGIYSPPDGMRAMQDLAGPLGRAEDGGKHGSLGGPGAGGSMPIMSSEDAESAMVAARKETEKLEKGLNQVIRRNRRLLLGTGS